jgi:hypothetical protein
MMMPESAGIGVSGDFQGFATLSRHVNPSRDYAPFRDSEATRL